MLNDLGRKSNWVVDQAVQQNRPIPEALLKNEVVLTQGLELFYTAYFELTSERRYVEGKIPWSSINAYCDHHNIRGEQREDMHYHISQLDVAYHEYRISLIPTANK